MSRIKLAGYATSSLKLLMWCLLAVNVIAAVSAETLTGTVEKDSDLMRLRAPGTGQRQLDSAIDQTRLRPPVANDHPAPYTGLLDAASFGAPGLGRADNSGTHNGLIQSSSFPPARNFDIGAERQSRELVIAWERWHHQLSQSIYERWTRRARVPGIATVRVTVTRDHQIIAQVLRMRGGDGFEESLMSAIYSLNGNPGLEFPSKSQRQQVSFEADYVASSDVQPGFSWVKNDYEDIQENK